MSQDDEKKQRLAQALRANLRRRKAQSRGQEPGAAPSPEEPRDKD
ncbi:hypothetical protein [Stakelama marina]|nr:hypothetical protein [Stakelama marina]